MDKFLAFPVIAACLFCANPAVAQNLLSNGNLDSPGIHESDLIDDWVLVEGPAGNTATAATFADHTGAGGVGLWYRPFEGTLWNDPRPAVFADLFQDVPATPGALYTMTGWARFEANWPGGLEFLPGDWPPNTPSPTRTEFALEFVDAGATILPQSVVVDLHDDRGQQNDGVWVQHMLMAVAPAGAVTVRVRASMIDGLSPDQNPQSAFVDDFELTSSGEAEARFAVSKDFSDGNPAEVEVTLSCNTGLPLQQTTAIAEGDPVNFVITDYDPGTLDCDVTETVPEGYTASYDNGAGPSPEGCSYEDVLGGQNACVVTNTLDPVEVAVTKTWIDENPQFNALNTASAEWSCDNVASGDSSGALEFFGDDTASFQVFPSWDGGTTCEITEVDVPDGGVETDDSGCASIVVFPGTGGECEIVNTRLYAGIPALDHLGLTVLTLILLVTGWAAFRRPV